MRKWRDLAATDDPDSWSALSGMWPTRRGTYETADISSGTSVTGPANTNILGYAFAFGTSSSGTTQEFVGLWVSGTTFNLCSWDGTTLTSRFSVAAGTGTYRGRVAMVRYGNTALLSMRFGAASKIQAATFGAAFADASASAPTERDILCVVANAVLAFSSASNAWAASDVGDYTNWTTGESSSGTIYDYPGNVTAAVPYSGCAYVFKQGSIHRMHYVGGSSIKWTVETAWVGVGVPDRATLSNTTQPTQDWAVVTQHGIVFYGGNGYVYLFDGASEPRCLNPETTIPVETIRGVFTYDPSQDVVCIAPSHGSATNGTAILESSTTQFTSLYHYYNFASDAWGSGFGSDAEKQAPASGVGTISSGVLRGDYFERTSRSSKPVFWAVVDQVGALKRCAPTDPISTTACYLQSQRFGRADGMTSFSQVKPLLRRRTNSSGSGTASLSAETFTELDNTTAATTDTVSESTFAQQFDYLKTARFARFKVTWTGLDVEVNDFLVLSKFTLGAK